MILFYFILFQELDGDQKKLSAYGKVASRDIVQFVELRRFLQGNYWSKELLAKEVLAEIPQQFVDLFGLFSNTKIDT